MFSYCVIVLFIFIVNILDLDAADIPSFIHVCKRDDPDISTCLTKSIEDIRPHLKTGYPEYNIPSIEPIQIKELIKEESAGLKIETTDVVAHGGGDFIVKDVNVNADQNKFEVDVLIPALTVDAKYSMDGKLAMLPLKGNGDFFATFTDCRTHVTIVYEFFDLAGEEHMRFNSFKLRAIVGGGNIRLDGLFGGDKTLSKVVNDAINKNIDPFVKELMPYIEKSLSDKFMEIGNKIIEPYTAKQLFP